MGLLHNVAGNRKDPRRTRSTRGLVVHAAVLRCLHDSSCNGERTCGGRCSQARDSRQRPIHSESHPDQSRFARPHLHFYHLSALDWVDVLQIPKADPAKASSLAESLSPWVRNSKNEMKAAQDKVKAVAEKWTVGHFRQRILGASGNAPSTRSEFACLLTLSASVGISA